MATIVWFRHDLRLEDHPALMQAALTGLPLIPVYIWAPEEEGHWSYGSASKWWLHHSLKSLDQELRELGSQLVIRRGSLLAELKKLVQETQAVNVFWSRRYEPYAIRQTAEIKRELTEFGVKAESFNSHLIFEPWTVHNQQNKPYQVFTPFWKACLRGISPSKPLPKPERIATKKVSSLKLEELELLPRIHWDEGLTRSWQPGAPQAKKRLLQFVKKRIQTYFELRDRPDLDGVSRLSPHLHFGEISPRMVWHQAEGQEPYLRQLGWREFAYHLLYHFPFTPDLPLQARWEKFPWKENPLHLKAWQKGETGYPIVDAGMRQLWTTGWMHNRVRMIVGSFLVKDLLLPWNEGAKWFWDTLVDADLANNTLGWQWVGGCGADAAPYFRVFNPTLQGQKFDPEGVYVRQWIPELKDVETRWIHQPWLSGKKLAYPQPLVDHDSAKKEALKIYREFQAKDS